MRWHRPNEIAERDGRLTLDFEDFEGQRLSLIDDEGTGESYPWDKSPFRPFTRCEDSGRSRSACRVLDRPTRFSQRVMNMRPIRDYPLPDDPKRSVQVYDMGPGGAGAELHVAVQPDLPVAQQGAGGVHHVAFRTPDADYDAWAERLASMEWQIAAK